MAFDPLTAILNIGNTIIDRLIPDKSQASALKTQLIAMQQKGEFDNDIAQLQVDQAEAQSHSVFVAGWRPFIGWSCGAAFVYAYIVQPCIQTFLVVFHSKFDPALLPKMDLAQMLPVLLGMLGLGAYRSYEKVNGVSTEQINK